LAYTANILAGGMVEGLITSELTDIELHGVDLYVSWIYQTNALAQTCGCHNGTLVEVLVAFEYTLFADECIVFTMGNIRKSKR